MKTTSAATDTETAKATTKSFFLIEIEFPTTLRLSTGPAVTWNGYSWTASGIRYKGKRDLAAGGEMAKVELPNTDNSASALVLTHGIEGRAIKIWEMYGAGPHSVGDEIEEFVGVLDSTDEMSLTSVVLGAVSEGRSRLLTPRIYFDHVFNHTPSEGTVLKWGGQQYELGARHG